VPTKHLEQNTLDQKDLDILRYVMENPRASLTEIADNAGAMKIPLGTTQKRVQRLLHDKYLERVLRVVDLGKLGYQSRHRIDIYINPREIREGEAGYGEYKSKIKTQEELAAFIMNGLPKEKIDNTEKTFGDGVLVENVTILLGHRADLSAVVWTTDRDVLTRFVTDGLRQTAGIQNTNTALEAWSVQEALRKEAPPATHPRKKLSKRVK
jgi:DNA-binding Lrp family transcriptional regulator